MRMRPWIRKPIIAQVGIGTGAVVCMASDLMPIDANNWHVPVWMI